MRGLILIVLMSLNISALNAQEDQLFTFHGDFGVGMTLVTLTGTADIGGESGTIIDNNTVVSAPVYVYTEEQLPRVNWYGHLGCNLAFLRFNNSSVGLNLNVGGGRTRGAYFDDLPSIFFDFPQYAYFRTKIKNFEFSTSLGYRHLLIRSFSRGEFMAAFEVHFNEIHGVRLFGTPLKRTYYQAYTNGTVKPLISFSEFGVVYTFSF